MGLHRSGLRLKVMGYFDMFGIFGWLAHLLLSRFWSLLGRIGRQTAGLNGRATKLVQRIPIDGAKSVCSKQKVNSWALSKTSKRNRLLIDSTWLGGHYIQPWRWIWRQINTMALHTAPKHFYRGWKHIYYCQQMQAGWLGQWVVYFYRCLWDLPIPIVRYFKWPKKVSWSASSDGRNILKTLSPRIQRIIRNVLRDVYSHIVPFSSDDIFALLPFWLRLL